MYLKKMAAMSWGGSGSAWNQAYIFAKKAIKHSQTEILKAREILMAHLGHTQENA